ncbi:MAG: hypothetical protein Kow0090_22330 [Myxococcota bacterium]
MNFKKKILIFLFSLALLFAIMTYAAVKTGFLIVEYDVKGNIPAELEMFAGADITTSYQDAIPIYRTEPGKEPVLNYGWLVCMDRGEGFTLPYTRLIKIRWEKKRRITDGSYYEAPINAIDLSAGQGKWTDCSQAAIFIVKFLGYWCPIVEGFLCLPRIEIEIKPISLPQKIALKEDILTVNLALWQVYTENHPVNEAGHFTLEQIAKMLDYYDTEGDAKGGLTLEIKKSVDRIWGQCGIQFKLNEKWGRQVVDNKKYQMKVAENLAHPHNRFHENAILFMGEARKNKYFQDLMINLYLFPMPLTQNGACSEGTWGMTMPRENWYSEGLCPPDTLCKGGDVFINNDIECLKTFISGFDNQETYNRISRTVAHEIGHILLQDLTHPNCITQVSPDNLMVTTNPLDINPCYQMGAGLGNMLARQQCETAKNNLRGELSFLLID